MSPISRIGCPTTVAIRGVKPALVAVKRLGTIAPKQFPGAAFLRRTKKVLQGEVLMNALYGAVFAAACVWLRAPPPHPLRLLAMTKVIAGTSRKYMNIGLNLRSRSIPTIGGGMSAIFEDTGGANTKGAAIGAMTSGSILTINPAQRCTKTKLIVTKQWLSL
jgi:hypothetical protein